MSWDDPDHRPARDRTINATVEGPALQGWRRATLHPSVASREASRLSSPPRHTAHGAGPPRASPFRPRPLPPAPPPHNPQKPRRRHPKPPPPPKKQRTPPPRPPPFLSLFSPRP